MDPRNEHDDRGQALPLLVIFLGAAVGASMLLVAIGRVAVLRAEARTAADAGALAAAGADAETGIELALRNGGQFPKVDAPGDGTYRVTLLDGPVIAAATARRIDPPPVEGTG
ncbi:MAG: pilus assembly protein TadG-related protein, partial [Actinomycetota bacterium]